MNRFNNFFAGRYGTDQLGWFLFIVGMIIELVGMFTHIRIIYYIGLIMFILYLARSFSRNIPKRAAENQKFLDIKNRLLNWNYFRKQNKANKEQAKQWGGTSKTVYCYFYCPSCRQQVRVPAGKGKIRVTCPKCKNTFEAHT